MAAVSQQSLKRPQSAYMLWLNSNRSAIIEEHFSGGGVELLEGRMIDTLPERPAHVTDVVRKAGEIWRGMSEEEKQPYIDLAAAKKQEYQEKKAKSKPSTKIDEMNPPRGWSKPIPGSYINKFAKGTPYRGYATFQEAVTEATQLGPGNCGGITKYGPQHPRWANRYTLRRPGTGAKPQPEKAIQETPYCKDEVSWEFRSVPETLTEVPENSDGWVNLPGSTQQEYPVLSSQDLMNQSVDVPARGPSPTSQMVTGAVGSALGVAADLARRSAMAFREQLGKAHQMITAQKRQMETMGEDLKKLDGDMKEMSTELQFLRGKVSLDEQRDHWIKENNWMSSEDYERRLLDAGKKSPEEVAKVAEQYFKQKPLPRRFRNEPEQVEESEDEEIEVEEIEIDGKTYYHHAEDGELFDRETEESVGKLVDGKIVAM